MARFFSQCVRNLKYFGEDCSELVAIVTEFPAAASVLKVFPKLAKSDLLPDDVVEKAKKIVHMTKDFVTRAESGLLTLNTFGMMTDINRLDRLVQSYETFCVLNSQIFIIS